MFTTPLINRLAAVLLLITTILAAYTFVAEPIIVGYSETSQEIQEAREQLSRFERAAAMRPALDKQMSEFMLQERLQGYYLTGKTDALAAAKLQDLVNVLITEKGGTLQSIQPMPGVEEQGLMRITLRVQMTGATETLFDVLYTLESGKPVLFIDDLDIQGRAGTQPDGEAGDGASQAESLSVAFDLSGYLPRESK